MSFLDFFLFLLSILPFASSSKEMLDLDLFQRSMIIELPQIDEAQLEKWPLKEEVELQCTSWRVAVEANNISSPWKTIPNECGDYLQEYMIGGSYELDLERVSNDAEMYARRITLSGDGKDAWIFDVDETLLSNLPYYAVHDYGLETFDSVQFNQWVETGMAPAIESSLKLYEEVLKLGFEVILLTGRSERQRDITIENLSRAGFRDWKKLILRSTDDDGKSAVKYKSDKRDELVEEGYRIVGNSGDQWSDLLGRSTSTRSFKLPNPMYCLH